VVHAVPNVQQTLLQSSVGCQCFAAAWMHSLLDVVPYLVIDRLKVGAARRPQRMKVGVDGSKIAQCCMPGVQVRRLVEG